VTASAIVINVRREFPVGPRLDVPVLTGRWHLLHARRPGGRFHRRLPTYKQQRNHFSSTDTDGRLAEMLDPRCSDVRHRVDGRPATLRGPTSCLLADTNLYPRPIDAGAAADNAHSRTGTTIYTLDTDGVASSGPFESVFDSLQLYFGNSSHLNRGRASISLAANWSLPRQVRRWAYAAAPGPRQQGADHRCNSP
jgi:hypothetical protein